MRQLQAIRAGEAAMHRSGGAPCSGRGGRRFKSCHSDQSLAELSASSAKGRAKASPDEARTRRQVRAQPRPPIPSLSRYFFHCFVGNSKQLFGCERTLAPAVSQPLALFWWP